MEHKERHLRLVTQEGVDPFGRPFSEVLVENEHEREEIRQLTTELRDLREGASENDA